MPRYKPTADDLRRPFGVEAKVLEWVVENGWTKALISCGLNPDTSAYASFTEVTLGLKNCFRYLQHIVPSPEENWYVAVFHNYDLNEDGYIDFDDFKDMVVKYHNYHAQRNLRHHRQKQRQVGNGGGAASSSGRSPPVNSLNKLMAEAKARDEAQGKKREAMDGSQFASHIIYPIHQEACQVYRDYTIGSEAGQGAFGKVQIVTHKVTGSKRACKTVVIARPRQWDLILQEIEIMKQLNHPNILRLYEIYSDGYTVYLILELCEGGQLFDRIVEHYERQRRAITEQQVAAWMTELLSAIAYCHDKNIVHRDIKPENILFVDSSEKSPIKLIDFGLSSSLDRIKETQHEEVARKSGVPGMLAKMMPKIGGKPLVSTSVKRIKMQRAGTPHYMAPEMIRGSYDTKCDIFSIGVIMHQLLSGVHPYYVPGVDDEKSVEVKILETVPTMTGPEWSFVSAAAKDLCRALLRRTPAKRLSAKEALQHPWFDSVKQSGAAPSLVSMSVFDGLRNWQNENKLKQAVVQLIARELSEKEICDLRRKFKALDRENDGMISLSEVRQAMRDAGHDVIESDLAAMFASLAGGNGRIGWNEFLAALLCKRTDFQETQLREIFRKLDTKNEGKISIEMLKTVLKTGDNEEDAAEVFEDVGRVSADGYINFIDFVTLMTPEQFSAN